MSEIHGINTRTDGGNKGCSYEPIRVFCMKKDTFQIMTKYSHLGPEILLPT